MNFLKKVLKFSLICVVFIILIKLGVYIYINSTNKLEINNANNIMLYDKNNKLYFQGNETKKWVPLNNISKHAINATIYTEDKHFYQHNGFDYFRIIRAGATNIANRKTEQGASTISQQYAKNLFLDFDKTWMRKWQEMWYTIKIEHDYSKKNILEGYLNTINYGHGIYGIENAAEFYYNKKAKDLSLAEASMIVGIPKSPANYSPIINYNKAKKRQKYILNVLLKNNIITNEEMKKAYSEKLSIIAKKNTSDANTVMYYHDAVLNELKKINTIPKSLNDTKGLKIYTTMDQEAQKNLEFNINNNIPKESKIETSAVMMNPNNGAIIALIGGRNYNKSSYNRAIDSKRQVGSTMKPYLYYSALENGFTTSTTFTSAKTTFSFKNGIKYTPQNYNNKYGDKPISMATAIAYSDNVYAVKTHLFLGENVLVDTARKVGITSKLEKIPSLPLGTNEINIIEMARGYSAFANEGYKIKPHLIRKVEDKKGNVLYEFKEEKLPVLNKSICYILNNALTSTYDKDFVDYNYPTALGIASKMTHKYALKSGTTSTDNWNIGYNKKILTAVWVGYDNNNELKKEEYKYSQNIWIDSMEKYLENKKNEWYKKPENVVGVLVNPITGELIKQENDRKKIMYFIRGTEPNENQDVFEEKFENVTLT